MSKIPSLKPSVAMLDTRINPGITQRVTGRKLQAIRIRIMEMDGYSCRACGRVTLDLVIDHIVPLHRGGADSDSNRQALCKACHDRKTELEGEARAQAGDSGHRGRVGS